MSNKFIGVGSLVAALAFAWVGTALAVGGNIGQGCESCHVKTYESSINHRFVHMPFEQRQCRICHLAEEGDTARANRIRQRSAEIKKISWLAEGGAPANDHWFLLPISDVSESLMFEVGIPNGPAVRREVPMPPASSIKEAQDDGVAPVISDVQVLEVSRGLYIEARIACKTDELSSSAVQYGVDELDKQTPVNSRMVVNHEVLLSGLAKNKKYKYAVVSEDAFGNRSVSKVFSFTTRHARYPDRGGRPSPVSLRGGVKLEHEVIRNGDHYLTHVTASRPVLMSIGIPETAPLGQAGGGAGKEKMGENHPVMKDKRGTNILVCYSCHESAEGTSSHPVDVRPKPGMVIPAEYTTLPDGRLTCMSCHAGHSSDTPYRLLKPTKKALCTGCHVEMV